MTTTWCSLGVLGVATMGLLAAEDPTAAPPLAELSGALSIYSSYGLGHTDTEPDRVDPDGWSALRPRVDLTMRGTGPAGWRYRLSGSYENELIYRLRGTDAYPEAVRDQFTHDVQLGETWIAGDLGGGGDLKLGRQMVLWGKADLLRVCDVVNPLDQREPGLVDLEYQRLPTGMLRVGWERVGFTAEGLAIGEQRFSRLPAPGSEFLPPLAAYPPIESPASTLANFGLGGSLTLTMDRYEAALHLLYHYDDTLYAVTNSADPSGLTLQYPRVTVISGEGSMVMGEALIFAEAAITDGLRSWAVPDQDFRRLDVLGGIEWAGWTNHLIALEVCRRHLFDWESSLDNPVDGLLRDRTEIGLRWNGNFHDDTWHTEVQAVFYGSRATGGGYQRAELRHDLFDGMVISLGLMLYHSGDDSSLAYLDNNDRVYLRSSYRF